MPRDPRVARAFVVRAAVAALVVGAAAAGARADDATTPEAFAGRFVAAVDGRDRASISALLDTRSLACLSGENAPLLDENFRNWTNMPIPPRYRTRFDPLGPDAKLVLDAFMPGRFDYPVRPTQRMQIDFDESDSHVQSLIAELGLEAGVWKVVLPCPKPGTMAWIGTMREEGAAQAAGQAATVDALVAGMSAGYRDELTAIAKGGRRIEAVHKLEKDRQVELAVAVLAMKRIAPLDGAAPAKP
ncbi:MAG: hypothetical protein ABSG83_10130 [Roseiarcus sp.]|jgi:hypothetical protein